MTEEECRRRIAEALAAFPSLRSTVTPGFEAFLVEHRDAFDALFRAYVEGRDGDAAGYAAPLLTRARRAWDSPHLATSAIDPVLAHARRLLKIARRVLERADEDEAN